MRVKFEIVCEDFSFLYLPLYINKKIIFLFGPESCSSMAAKIKS